MLCDVVEAEIGKEEINNSRIYPLVYEYLEFHDYQRTLALCKD